MLLGMEKLGSIVSRIAARLRPADEEIWTAEGAAARLRERTRATTERKKTATPALGSGESGGQVDPRGAGKSASTTQGRNVVEASAHDREGSGTLFGGRYSAHTESKFRFAGAVARPGRAVAYAPTLKLGRASIA